LLATALAAVAVAAMGPWSVGALVPTAEPGDTITEPAVLAERLAGLEVEAIEEGVVRVLADDADHDFRGGRVREVVAGPDGSVWVAQGRRVMAVGVAGDVEARGTGWRTFPRRLSIDHSGTAWAQEDVGTVVNLRDGAWQPAEDERASLAASFSLVDGQAWRILADGDEPTGLAMLGVVRWHELAGPPALAASAPPAQYSLALDADDRLWLAGDAGPGSGWLARYDGDTWSSVTELDGVPIGRVLAMTTDRDDTFWLLAEATTSDCEHRCDAELVLAGQSEDGWRVFAADAGMPQDDARIASAWAPGLPTPLAAADGVTWFALPRLGVFRFDGATFERIEAAGLGSGALDLAIDDAGNVWLATLRGRLVVLDGETRGAATAS
jgi:ligand-binding sensor domain-containing protein